MKKIVITAKNEVEVHEFVRDIVNEFSDKIIEIHSEFNDEPKIRYPFPVGEIIDEDY